MVGLGREDKKDNDLLSGAVQSSYEDIKGNYEYKNGRLFKNGVCLNPTIDTREHNRNF